MGLLVSSVTNKKIMKLYRIQAVILRHLLLTVRVFGNLISLLYWPLINIIVWGLNSVWNYSIQQQPWHVTVALLTALTLWQVLFRISLEIGMSLYDEITSYDFTSLFSTPLKPYEWMIALMILGFLKSGITFLFCIGIIGLFYGINILSIGLLLLPFIILIILTGWSVGFLTAAGIIYWGKSVHELVWVVAWAFVPLSGIFYSLTILPSWLQKIAWYIPQSHIFEALRTFLLTGNLSHSSLLVCLLMSSFYLLLSLLFFKYIFEKSRAHGFSRLEK